MAKKKDCFGSETYVCRTRDCPYMAECVQTVWDKKLSRVIARKETLDGKTRPLGTPVGSSKSVRLRSKDFMPRGARR